jgi:hypothetical protein
MPEARRALLEFCRDFYEDGYRAANHLLIANGAALGTCVALLKGYDDAKYLRGIGTFIYLFAIGFVLASLGYAALMIFRQAHINAFTIGRKPPKQPRVVNFLPWTLLALSAALLLGGVLLTAHKLVSL